jgi:hypothetical protein
MVPPSSIAAGDFDAITRLTVAALAVTGPQ